MLLGLLGTPAVWIVTSRIPTSTHRADLPGLEQRLRRHVEALAGIGPRSPSRPQGLREAAEYITSEWRQLGYKVRAQTYTHDRNDTDPSNDLEVSNLEVVVPGSDARSSSSIVIGAHYDTVAGTPGADDNATGVAVLLELSRAVSGARPGSTLRLVAFVCEEPPSFQTQNMGSWQYARERADSEEPVKIAISLESLGYYSDEEGSQQYPAPLGAFYPSRGNFIGIVGNVGMRSHVDRLARLLAEHGAPPVETAALPSALPGIGWSDHWSFWQFGIPAVMVTDTAPYRNPHYHAPTDTPDTLDYATLAQLTAAWPAVALALTDGDRQPGWSRGMKAFGAWVLFLGLLLVVNIIIEVRQIRKTPSRSPTVEAEPSGGSE